jgi:hypothetical protein
VQMSMIGTLSSLKAARKFNTLLSAGKTCVFWDSGVIHVHVHPHGVSVKAWY